MSNSEQATFFERLKKGLEDSAAYSRGELSLKTVELPTPPRAASPKRVQMLRKKLRMSQSIFAATLNVSPKLVQSWEQGSRRPGRGDLRLIELIERQPDIINVLFATAGKDSGKSGSSRRRRAAA